MSSLSPVANSNKENWQQLLNLLLTLYCLFLSWTVWPSWAWLEVEQVSRPGHLHCFSIQGAPYVSTFPHTARGEHTGSEESESCNRFL